MNEVSVFMYYMFNYWSFSEAQTVFGVDLGCHLWNKWLESFDLSNDHTMYWYAELDNECKQKVVERSKALYG